MFVEARAVGGPSGRTGIGSVRHSCQSRMELAARLRISQTNVVRLEEGDAAYPYPATHRQRGSQAGDHFSLHTALIGILAISEARRLSNSKPRRLCVREATL
jgi:hypothetical protein